jgi:hypothetical protein
MNRDTEEYYHATSAMVFVFRCRCLMRSMDNSVRIVNSSWNLPCSEPSVFLGMGLKDTVGRLLQDGPVLSTWNRTVLP